MPLTQPKQHGQWRVDMVTICPIPEKISSIQGFTCPTAVTVKWKIRELLLENLTLIKFGVLSALIIWDCIKRETKIMIKEKLLKGH